MRKRMTRPARRTPQPCTITLAASTAAALLLLGVPGCSAGDSGAAPSPTPTPSATSSSSFAIEDPWVKAADEGMTAAFGTLVNRGDRDVRVVGATCDVARVEMHTMAMQGGTMVMKNEPNGFTVKAGGTHRLEPGGDHLMLIDITKPIRAGDTIACTLTLDDDRTVDFTAVAKPFTGAEEQYDPDAPDSEHDANTHNGGH